MANMLYLEGWDIETRLLGNRVMLQELRYRSCARKVDDA